MCKLRLNLETFQHVKISVAEVKIPKLTNIYCDVGVNIMVI